MTFFKHEELKQDEGAVSIPFINAAIRRGKTAEFYLHVWIRH